VRIDEGGVLGRDDELHLAEQVECAAAGYPVDRGDHRLPQVSGGLRADPVPRVVEVQRRAAAGADAEFGVAERAAVHVGAEGAVARAGQHDGADGVVLAQLAPERVQLPQHPCVEGVVHLGPVQGHPGDAVVAGPVVHGLETPHARPPRSGLSAATSGAMKENTFY
jgi:hypothetical protein